MVRGELTLNGGSAPSPRGLPPEVASILLPDINIIMEAPYRIIIMKFHPEMAKPFIEKADRIERNFLLLKDESLSEKSMKNIAEINAKYSRIQKHCIPTLEKATGQKFPNPNLFYFVFLYQEFSGLFNEAQTQLSKISESPLTKSDFEEMKEISENRLTLAHIGDAALEISVMPCIWQKSSENTIPSKNFLHLERGKVVDNLPLSKYWDSLSLYDSSILIQRPDENSETKGSNMESVFGIIYLEHGVGAVENALKNMMKCN